MKALPVLQIRALISQCSERNFTIESERFLKFETWRGGSQVHIASTAHTIADLRAQTTLKS
jgi:hypothetical protein